MSIYIYIRILALKIFRFSPEISRNAEKQVLTSRGEMCGFKKKDGAVRIVGGQMVVRPPPNPRRTQGRALKPIFWDSKTYVLVSNIGLVDGDGRDHPCFS